MFTAGEEDLVAVDASVMSSAAGNLTRKIPWSPPPNTVGVACTASDPNKGTGLSVEAAQIKLFGDDEIAPTADGSEDGEDTRRFCSQFMAGKEDFCKIAAVPRIPSNKGKAKAPHSPLCKAACTILEMNIIWEDVGRDPDQFACLDQMSDGSPPAGTVAPRVPCSTPSKVARAVLHSSKRSDASIEVAPIQSCSGE